MLYSWPHLLQGHAESVAWDPLWRDGPLAMSHDANDTLLMGFRRHDSPKVGYNDRCLLYSPFSSYNIQWLRFLLQVLDSSPLLVGVAVLLVFVLSPMILCGNALILTALCRFKRLKTPSNYFIISLATSDLGAGVFLPIGLYLELTSEHNLPSSLCLLPYCFAIFVCSASVGIRCEMLAVFCW